MYKQKNNEEKQNLLYNFLNRIKSRLILFK